MSYLKGRFDYYNLSEVFDDLIIDFIDKIITYLDYVWKKKNCLFWHMRLFIRHSDSTDSNKGKLKCLNVYCSVKERSCLW